MTVTWGKTSCTFDDEVRIGTKDQWGYPLAPLQLRKEIGRFMEMAKLSPDTTFNIQAHPSPMIVAGLFYSEGVPDNIVLPKEFTKFKPKPSMEWRKPTMRS
jgi:hypothetical protein